MKRSCVITKGIWQYEFCEDKIAVAKWDKIPESTVQWVEINAENPWFIPKYDEFSLEGTCNEDIRVVAVIDDFEKHGGVK